jgi:hypothetical protein
MRGGAGVRAEPATTGRPASGGALPSLHSAVDRRMSEVDTMCHRHMGRSMKVHIGRIALTAMVALTVQVVASPADARKARPAAKARGSEAIRSPSATAGPTCVRAGGRVIDCDPDPFIRGEILRHYTSGWPD